MKNIAKFVTMSLVSCAGSASALGTVTATTSCGTATATFVPSVGKWDVSVSIPSGCSANPVDVAIRGATSDEIRNVAIDAQAS